MRDSPAFSHVAITAVREYWNARPCNIRHSTKTVGSEEYFHEVEYRKYRVEPHIPEFAQFELWQDKKVLEIGCGIGTDTINFARHGAEVTAADLSEKSLEIAERRAEVFDLGGRIQFVHANAESLDEAIPPAQSFDLVYSFGVLHHTPHPDEALEQIRRQIKPGGVLKVMVYHRWSWKALWIVLTLGQGRFWKADELIARYSEAQTGCPVTYSYSRRSGRAWLASHGFEVTEVSVDHIFPYEIGEYIQHRYKVVWYFRWMPARCFRWLERRLGWHLLLTARAPFEPAETR